MWLLCLGLWSCGGASPSQGSPSVARMPPDEAGGQAAAVPLPPPPVPDRAADAPADPVLSRARLDALVDQGVGRLLQYVQVEPARRQGRFIGHRVVAVDPAWADGAVREGDIVVRLNGVTLESPDKAQKALATLRVASELVVELLRDAEPLRVRYAIR